MSSNEVDVKYSTTERNITSIPPPNKIRLDDVQLYENGKPRTDILAKHFREEGRLSNKAACRIVKEATQLLLGEPNVLTFGSPATVCGDVHGQFYDLLRLFEIGGDPKHVRFLFLGDYVDRGYFSAEVILYLYAMKLRYPKNILMLRGNHESRHLTSHFTFQQECKVKYTENFYKLCVASFDALPLAALMNNQFLCLHAGISPHIQTLKDLDAVDRFCEPPTSGPMCDVLWSDPDPNFGKEGHHQHFIENKNRGCSYFYSYKAVCTFLERNKLLSVVRGHEAQDAGFKMYKQATNTKFPAVITIFSAPNYCDTYGNKAAILKYENDVLNVKTFGASPHPYLLPNFMNAFSWSIPFVADKLTEMLLGILNVITDEETTDDEKTAAAKREIIRNKIRAVSKMGRMYSILRANNDQIVALKGLSTSGKLPLYALEGGKEKINSLLQGLETDKELGFDKAQELDRDNERLPPIQS